MSERTYGIIGTGALGGYYGARLHHAGCDVRFLLHSDYEHVRRHGLRVESKHGDFSIEQPRVYATPADFEPVDVAVVAMKTTANDQLPQIMPHVVKPDGAVLVMQNGLGVEEQVAAASPEGVRENILGGLAFLCSHKIGPGHIRHLDYGQVRFGHWSNQEKARGVTDVLRSVADDFEHAGLPVEVEADLLLARWKKLLWNMPYNGLSVALNTTTDRLMGHGPTRALCIDIMWEAVRGAAAMDRQIGRDLVEQMIEYTDQMVAYKPSMLIDHEHGRPLELEAIYGYPLRKARERGERLVRTEMLHQMLTLVDGRGG